MALCAGMSNDQFRRDFAKIIEKAGKRADLVVRQSMFTLVSRLIETSPVKEGRFKNNWNTSLNSVDTTTSWPPDKDGSGALERAKQMLNTWKPGQIAFMTNSMPYAKKLEDGSSTQAPYGVVKLTLQNYALIIEKAAREAK